MKKFLLCLIIFPLLFFYKTFACLTPLSFFNVKHLECLEKLRTLNGYNLASLYKDIVLRSMIDFHKKGLMYKFDVKATCWQKSSELDLILDSYTKEKRLNYKPFLEVVNEYSKLVKIGFPVGKRAYAMYAYEILHEAGIECYLVDVNGFYNSSVVIYPVQGRQGMYLAVCDLGYMEHQYACDVVSVMYGYYPDNNSLDKYCCISLIDYLNSDVGNKYTSANVIDARPGEYNSCYNAIPHPDIKIWLRDNVYHDYYEMIKSETFFSEIMSFKKISVHMGDEDDYVLKRCGKNEIDEGLTLLEAEEQVKKKFLSRTSSKRRRVGGLGKRVSY